MVRRSGWVRLVGSGFRGAATFAITVAVVASACGGQSVTKDEGDDRGDAPQPPGDDDIVVGDEGDYGDDDGYGGGAGTGAVGQGGMGAIGNTGGVIITGGTVSFGGTVSAGGTVPTGGVLAGGPPTGGVGGIPATGGTIPTAGVGGVAGGVNVDPECKGIKSNMVCLPEGKLCENLLCGIADSGRRACACATYWSCTTCDYTNSPFRDPPARIPACPPDVADEVACAQENTVCGPVGIEYCACYADATDGLIWDCDDPPTTW